MCIISFQYEPDSDKPLIVIANRDEFYARESQKAHYWDEASTVFGGLDVERGGSWLALNKNGRFAAVTNYRDFSLEQVGEKSRGELVSNFVESATPAMDYMKALQENRLLYGPMNLLVYDGENLVHFNNIENNLTVVKPGIHGLSNASIDTPWPKVERMKYLLQLAIAEDDLTVENLLTIGLDTEKPADARLPNTGVGLELERELSSIFVAREGYGTRNTSAIIMHKDGTVDFVEQSYHEGAIGDLTKEKLN